ncbi:hypothetical protein HMJ29_10950 [Hymenobacter taeanensis]|uniref:Uncharacterized protein n=1 Tax=Hymenobacter taeanensis TaxID=2735321 RepID=A0A6M6BH48_9BACT|nr:MULTISPECIES: hypothetical protein [Hymenobacter]QJX47426.1 hypothetical protein HMJ29_10950 [Hymenobacter taeanensis]UOQ83092.1 hypothetical protein MUN83_10165 [Hymenobacter sp. 5414T-23]
MNDQLLLRVRESIGLTGLGVLLFPASKTPELTGFALHTALQIRLRHPSGLEESTIATVEEVARPGHTHEDEGTTERVLLLTQEAASAPPTGTEVWWTGAEVDFW